jgi:EPS-associated MarR family transcriptional regulator
MANYLSSGQREDVHFRVLNLLIEHPEYSQRQIAAALGISLGRVNYCLNALAERGYVKIRNFRASTNKARYLRVLTPLGVAERTRLATQFLKRKMAEYELLHAEIERLRNEMSSSQ